MMEKTISELIDELSIVNCKIYTLMDASESGEVLKKIKALNGYRSQLKNAINEYFNERKEIKTYE